MPLPIHQELKLTIEGHKGLVFVFVTVRRRTSSWLNVLNQRGGEAAGDCGIDKNIDAVSKDTEGLDRGHCCSVDKLNAGPECLNRSATCKMLRDRSELANAA